MMLYDSQQALGALSADIKDATAKGEAVFAVDYYMVLAKAYELERESGGAGSGKMGKKRSKKKRKVETERFFANAEDEVFEGVAEMTISFKLAGAADTAGTKHYRTVMMIPKAKLAGTIAEIARLLPLDAANVAKLL